MFKPQSKSWVSLGINWIATWTTTTEMGDAGGELLLLKNCWNEIDKKLIVAEDSLPQKHNHQWLILKILRRWSPAVPCTASTLSPPLLPAPLSFQFIHFVCFSCCSPSPLPYENTIYNPYCSERFYIQWCSTLRPLFWWRDLWKPALNWKR